MTAKPPIPYCPGQETVEEIRRRGTGLMTDETTITRELILAPSRSLARKKSGLIKRGLELADEIMMLLSAEDYFERGEAKMYRDYSGAIDDFTKAIELNPEYADAYNSRGETKSLPSVGDYQGAIDDFTKAIEINPKNVLAYYGRGNTKYAFINSPEISPEKKLLSAIFGHPAGDYPGAIEDYTKAIELDPQHTALYRSRGQAKDKNGDFQGAIVDYAKAIELDPEDARTYYLRGDAKNSFDDHQGAIEDYTKAIEVDPQYAEAYYDRGMIKYNLLNEEGDVQGLIEDMTKAIEINPHYIYAYSSRARAMMLLKDYQRAIEDYTELIERDPGDLRYMDTYSDRGEAKYKLGDYQGATDDFTMAIELDPLCAFAYFGRRDARSKLGDQSGAESDLRHAREVIEAKDCFNTGYRKYPLRDYQGALDDFTMAIELCPKYASAYYYRGVMKSKLGDQSGAKSDLRRAKEWGFDPSPHHARSIFEEDQRQ